MRIALVMFCAALFCGTSVADEKPDFTVTATEYAKEYAVDKKAFAKKYQGKVVEVSATVWCVHLSRGSVFLNGYKKDAKDHVGQLVFASPPKLKLDDSQRVLAQGQQVTVRGKQLADHPELTDCAFVKVGPSTALPATVSGLAAEFKKDANKADEKYKGKSVVFQAKIVEAKVDPVNADAKFTLTDPAGKSGLKIEAKGFALLDSKMAAEMRKLKVGDTVLLMGSADQFGTPFRLDNVFLLKEPPPGVKLPGDKK